MKRVICLICIYFCITLIMISPAEAGWTTVYQEDFSSDPGWTTNNEDHYFWDMLPQAYYQKEIDDSDEYSYKTLPGLQAGMTWRLEYDLYPARFDWAGDARLGFVDSDLYIESEEGLHPQWMSIIFAKIDQGYVPIIRWLTSEGNSGGYEYSSNRFTPGTWYNILFEYDPDASQIYTLMKERESGTILVEDTLSVIGTFTSDIDRLAMSTLSDDYAPGATGGATGISYIDNITVSQIPAPGAIILGGIGAGFIGWLRRKKAI